MSENEKLVIPAGVQFDLSGDGVSIEYSGDILLQGEHLRPVGRVVSTGGSVQIQGSMKVGQIESQRGSVSISGDITVGNVTASDRVVLDGTINFGSINAAGIEVIDGSVQGKLVQATEHVELRGTTDVSNVRAPKIAVSNGELTAKALEATDSITLGGAKLQVDVVMAPVVQVDPETTGRVAVIESDNDLGPNGIRGAFRLKEFAQFTGQNADVFLSERGVGGELTVVDNFDEEAETTQVSMPSELSSTNKVENETNLPDPTYEPEPTPTSTLSEPVETHQQDIAEELDDQPVIEPATIEENLESNDIKEDNEIPAWNSGIGLETATVEEDIGEDDKDSDIPAWNSGIGLETATAQEEKGEEDKDSDIPAWNSGLGLETPAAREDQGEQDQDSDIPAWDSTSESRPEPIRVSVEMTDESEPPAKKQKPLPPIATPKPQKPNKEQPGGKISPIHMELIGTVNSLVTCYDGKEVPPAITELQSLIDNADFSAVRAEITNIWNNLLKHHQRTGTRLQHQVTTTFNTVNTLVRKID